LWNGARVARRRILARWRINAGNRAAWCLAACICGVAAPVAAQTIPAEYHKLIAHHSEIGTLDGEFAGDHIDLSRGGLEITQTDVDIPGNNALPVRVSRRFEPNDSYGGGHFRYWSLDIPNVHGTFADIAGMGWVAETSGGYTANRCTSYGKPPGGFFRNPTSDTIWETDDYWHGTFFHLPGSGDQELLQFWTSVHAPSDGKTYHAMTKAGAVARCVALAATSDASVTGEGFEIVTSDGVVYTLNQMVKRYRGVLGKGQDALPRADYILFPTRIADRFGNTVTYQWSSTNPWQLQHIVASDGRQLDFTYESASSNRVTAVTDGTRTWHYAYSTTNGANDDADTVTLPDGSAWSLRLARLVYMSASTGTAHCDGINNITQRTGYDDGTGSSPYTGTITGPSGATVTFKMARVLLGRSHVAFNCLTDSPDADPSQARPDDPYLFYTAAMVHKTVSGPGLPSAGLNWSYSYGPTNNCWDGTYTEGVACTGSSPDTRSVLVTAPDGAVTRYTFGNRANVNEGMLQKTEYGWDGAQALRTVQIDYGEAGKAPYGSYDGWSPRGNGDPALTSRAQPQRSIRTTQQGITFTWEVARGCGGNDYCFDARARPTSVLRTGINTASVNQPETIAYDDDTVHWVLGQIAQRTIAGKVAAKTTFDASHRPWKRYAFGKLKQTITYNGDGTIASVADGNGHATTYSGWMRGVPGTVRFPATDESPAGATRTAAVDDRGFISSVTDESGYATAYEYDAMGRITKVTYPKFDSVPWLPTTSVFVPVTSAEHGVAAGHWRQTTATGTGVKVTLFDALWRPVLVHESDTAKTGTDRWVATAYDNAGHVAAASYPLASAPTMQTNATWKLGTVAMSGVRTAYDALGRPTGTTQDSEIGALTTSIEYIAGFKRRTTDARAHAITEQFMAWDTPTYDWPVRVDAPEGQSTTILRDTFGKPVSISRGGTP
jgi:YD repeat-containing protein